MSYNFTCKESEYFASLLEVVHLFFDGEPIDSAENAICLSATIMGKTLECVTQINQKTFVSVYDFSFKKEQKLEYKRYYKRCLKLSLYKALSEHTGKKSPWGSLTGVRPTKVWYDLQKEEVADVAATFRDIFLVSHEKTKLTELVVNSQKNVICRDKNVVDYYINIPFCTSKCHYCSFPSGLISMVGNHIERYVSCLTSEMRGSQEMIARRFAKVRAIYIGGGTPSSIGISALEKIFLTLPKCDAELTVEVGRPDEINEELLELLKKYGVTRISINPQSLSNATLKRVGRIHTAEEFFDKFALAKRYGLVINSDLIAALTGECKEEFFSSVDGLINLRPENITIHTLAIKRGAELARGGTALATHTDANIVGEMVEYSHKALLSAGYLPYYMYRQKYMAGNFENVGFCLPDFACLYNVDMMEETTNIVACGAGAISKKVFADGDKRIERVPNVKDILVYNERYQEMIERKMKIFDTNS